MFVPNWKLSCSSVIFKRLGNIHFTQMQQNIFLVGLMGSGKTTVGRLLAKRLGLKFFDSDQEIEKRTGATISWIFEIEGEDSFRQREMETLNELTSQQGILLATGGGSIIRPENREVLKKRGIVIYLRASVSNILKRTQHDRNRPLLQTEDRRAKIEELSRQREPFYQEVADIIVDTGRPNVHAMVQSIVNQIKGFKKKNMANRPKEKKTYSQKGQNSMQTQRKQRLKVELGERSYPIEIGAGLLKDKSLLAKSVKGKRIAIITNDVVAPLYLERLTQSLKASGKEVISLVLPDGEKEKNWESLMKIFDFLMTNKCDRKTTLAALGGGVIGDITGYAAASFMRGVPFVQVPTTLLSEVDSSVGGKTGINHPLGKNMIGAFYQPVAVIADTATLNTLPDTELSAGMAEVIKYGCIVDTDFFAWLEKNTDKLLERNPVALAYAIKRSCEIKADVVRQDEKESTGLRAILNFGHTFAHAIEAGMGYGAWLHGEAVGCGMVMAADLSHRMGWLDQETVNRIRNLVKKARLPDMAPDMSSEQWIDLMRVDKKNVGGEIQFVLLKKLGETVITKVPQNLLLETLAAYRSA